MDVGTVLHIFFSKTILVLWSVPATCIVLITKHLFIFQFMRSDTIQLQKHFSMFVLSGDRIVWNKYGVEYSCKTLLKPQINL
jgi:hypothetical protein